VCKNGGSERIVAAFGPIGLSLQRILSADLTPECRMASLPSAPVKQWPRKALTLACCLSLQLPLLAPWSRQAVAQGLPAPTAPRSLTSDNALPALGDINSQSLSPAAERRMGDRIMRSILRDPDVVDDPLVLEHVDQVWSSLLASARQRGEINEELDTTYAWRPFLVREKSVNAFALPGGYIGIHLGLLAMTNTSEEFASVLAHELSHVTQRHIARLISQSRQTSWVSIASMVLGALAMSRNPQAAQAMIIGGQGVAMQGQLNFSRDMEREADRVGFGVMLDAGYDPSGMAQMFELLAKASRLNDDNSYPYLRTHPLTTERIGEARARLGSAGLLGAPTARAAVEAREVLALRQALMSARSKVLMDTRSTALQTWLGGVTVPPSATAVDTLAAHYTRLVALNATKDRTQAEPLLKQWREESSRLPTAQAREARRVLALTEAEGLIDTGRALQALQILQAGAAQALQPDARPELILRGRAAMALPEVAEHQAVWLDAANRLQTWVATHPQDASAWQLLSGLWGRVGQPLRAVRADAEASAATGDLSGAIDRIDAARRRYPRPTGADMIELSVMDSRLRAWRQTLRDDAREDLG
jgi:predicted Zn-dependent protease